MEEINKETIEEKKEENSENSTPVVDENAHTYHTVDAKPVVLKDNYNFFFQSKFKYFMSRFIMILVGCICMPFILLFTGLRIRGRKNYKLVKKKGCILISNHINPGDAFFTGWSLMRRRVYITSLQSNLGLPFGFGKMIRIMGAVPIPEEKKQIPRFRSQFLKEIEKKRKILIYPEAALIPFCDHIRPFKKGAFRLAIVEDTPILPIVYTYRKPKFLYRLFRRKPCLTLNFLEPYYPPTEGSHAYRIEKTMDDLHQIMSDFFNEKSTYFYHKKEKKKKNKEENKLDNNEKKDE